jgi:hypothetical protein
MVFQHTPGPSDYSPRALCSGFLRSQAAFSISSRPARSALTALTPGPAAYSPVDAHRQKLSHRSEGRTFAAQPYLTKRAASAAVDTRLWKQNETLGPGPSCYSPLGYYIYAKGKMPLPAVTPRRRSADQTGPGPAGYLPIDDHARRYFATRPIVPSQRRCKHGKSRREQAQSSGPSSYLLGTGMGDKWERQAQAVAGPPAAARAVCDTVTER